MTTFSDISIRVQRIILYSLIALAFATPWLVWRFSVQHHRLSLVPPAMGVSSIVYAEEESGGFLGGHAAGIIVYEMPEHVAAALQQEGITYLERISQPSGPGLHRHYDNWKPSPVIRNSKWRELSCESTWQPISPGIADYMFRGAPCFRLDASIEQMASDTILQPDSYYTYSYASGGGGMGLIVLAPKVRRIIFAYGN